MSEADEVALTLLPALRVRYATTDELRAFVRVRMPDESPQVIDNVVESLAKRI